MKKFMNFLEQVLAPLGSKLAANIYMQALRDGFVYTLPFTLTGSIFLLIAAFPIPAVSEFMVNSGWDQHMYLVSGVTFDLMAIMAVLGISYHLAKSFELDSFVVSVLSLLSFFLVQATSVISESGDVVGGVIPKEFLGTKGVFLAILIGLIVPKLFKVITNWGITIKMPDGVPPAIARSFEAVVPVILIITLVWGVQIGFTSIFDGQTIGSVLYTTLQVPLQSLGNTLFGVTVVLVVTQLLWFFGIHGATVVMGVVSPIFTANSLANLDLYQAGQLALDNGAFIVTQNLFDSFINNGGSGMTLGIVLLMLNKKLFKSKQNQNLAKLSAAPAFFTINEPVLFGMPVVLNPLLFIPFIITPLVAAYITIFAIKIGFMPPMNGMMIPWTTPPIISGFIISGWQGSVVQIINICVTAAIWYPFFKMIDNQNLELESE